MSWSDCSLYIFQSCFKFALSWVSTRTLSKVACTTHILADYTGLFCKKKKKNVWCLCESQPAGHTGNPWIGAAPGMGLQSCRGEAQSFTSFLSYSALSCFISSICAWITLELFSIILTLKEKTEMLLCACRNQFNSWITIFKVKQTRLLLYLANCNLNRYELDV